MNTKDKLKSFILSLAILLALNSCQHPAKFISVNINNKYSILMADYMLPAPELQVEASLKYKNEEKDIYMIVIDENKKDLVHYNLKYKLTDYFKVVAAQPFLGSTHGKMADPVRRKINGSDALVAEITGDFNKHPVFYKLVVIETENRFYQILSWTGDGYKESPLPDIDRMIDSFKELKND